MVTYAQYDVTKCSIFPPELTNSMSPSREGASCAATQELPNILRNPQSSLPRSQEPSTDPHPEPDQFSPYYPIMPL